ncbi:MAG TPA: helix-turn-helix domain-containing protein [Rhizomicrobium sp.]
MAQLYAVPLEEMRGKTRGRPAVARARQIAIHIARVVFAMNHRDLAQEFGRDASTIRHACGRIEAMREASTGFDASMRWHETLVRRAAGLES